MMRRQPIEKTRLLREALIAAAALAWLGAFPVVYGQSFFTLVPCRLNVICLLPPEIATSTGLEQEFCRQLGERLASEQGPAWRVSVAPPSAEDRAILRAALRRDLPFDPPTSWRKVALRDKVVVLAVKRTGLGWHVVSRDWDVRVERLGPLVEHTAPTWSGVLAAAAETVRRAVVPVAQIRLVEQQAVRLDLQGSLLMEERSPLPRRQFLALARYEDRDGNARAVVPLPWTILQSPEGPPAEDGSVSCQIISGLKNPLSARRRGRVQLLAWAVTPRSRSVVLSLRNRQDSQKPLVGYEVLAQPDGEGSPQFLGRTDFAGQVEIPTEDPPGWKLLWVKHGRRVLAKVPLVDGSTEFTELALPDDDPRLLAEGYLMSVQDQLVDLVTLRSVLIARLRARIAAGDWEQAIRLRDQLLQLKSREVFSSELTQQQQRLFCPDPVGQKQIDKMFEETRRLVNLYLNPREVEELVKEIAMKAPRRTDTP
ncbi:MAG: hypothetical protein H5U08_03400 [Thermogutta sp.]|uniref:hypothetical protein n=1 Tax=Thermogutta sp. TaxID=1962930 RepID=UPI0019C576AF|nr:hypothetical protein [Thermogutta sp.]MBC7351381.1 hypothetical protein [Thermogutta sp.]